MVTADVRGGTSGESQSVDPVTGAYSRGLLLPRLESELARAAREGKSCSLFLFDVDFFKTVNDVFGHLRGDQILRQISDRVAGLVRGYDELFRYGGDEFVLLLPGAKRADAMSLALTITERVRGEKFPGTPPLSVSVSWEWPPTPMTRPTPPG